MALLRPLSGSGAYGVLASTIQDPAIGPDSYVGYLVSTFQGSTETTFYVLAGYFGVGAGPPLAPHAHRRPDRGRRGHRRCGHRLPLSLPAGNKHRLLNKFPDPPNKDVGEGLNTAFKKCGVHRVFFERGRLDVSRSEVRSARDRCLCAWDRDSHRRQ